VSENNIRDTDSWLYLTHFPDQTRVNLTKRGRLFIFQTNNVPLLCADVVSRVTWSRYRSNMEMSVPLSIIKMLLKTETDLFVSSFTVTSIGSQKVQFKVRLPVKIDRYLCKLIAIMCKTTGIFTTGNFQSDRLDKTEAFIEAFRQVFGIQLGPAGRNQRGYYIKITEHLASAIYCAFTGEKRPSSSASATVKIISAMRKLDEDLILTFLNAWFAFSRIYRSGSLSAAFTHSSGHALFMFRDNDETRELVKLLDTVGIEWENGSITEGNQFIPTYIVKNTVENKAILNLPFIATQKSKKHLLEEVSKLKVRISIKDDRIQALEKIIEELETKIDRIKEKKKQVSYSKYYYERSAQELRQKFEELTRLKNELEQENVSIREKLAGGIATRTGPPSAKEYDDRDKTYSEVLDELKSFKGFTATKRREFVYREEFHLSSEEESRPSSLASTSLTKGILKVMLTLLGMPENWVLFCLSESKPKTLDELKNILELDSKFELRKVINKYEGLEIIDISQNENGEEMFSLNWENVLRVVDKYRAKLTRNENPPEIKSYVKHVIPR